ncbi:hypothetical protein HDU96_003226 [Phlyctochytrium bullatum]|nr:hypothetical protein HDU96_003226 [Phlyctochytrium bullatum]
MSSSFFLGSAVAPSVGTGPNGLDDAAPDAYGTEDGDLRDEVLQNHYLKVQKKLLASVDRQVAEIETQLNEKDRVLERVEFEKNHLGEGLYKARSEIGKLNTSLASTRDYLEKTEAELKYVAADREAAEKQYQSTVKEKKIISKELEENRRKLEESNVKITKLGEINAVYTSGLKIHKRIESKLKKEVELSTDKRRQAEEDLEKERKRADELLKSKQELELILQAQKHETEKAVRTVSKLNREVNELEEQKKQSEKRWEEALTAMTKRDATMQHMDKARDLAKEELLEAQNIIRVLKLEQEESAKRLKEKELECEGLQNQVQFLRSNLNVMDSKQRETRASLVEAQVAESLYKEELNKVSKHHHIAKEELDRKSEKISDLKSKIDKMKNEFEEKIRNELIVQVAKKEEIVQARAEVEIQHIKRNEEGKNIDLRSENAQFRMKIHDLEERLRVAVLDKASYERCFNEVNTHYVRLYEEAKHLMYDLERKEHDVNYLKATIQEYNEVDKTRPFQMAIAKLQKDLEGAKAETNRMQNLWLESQKENMKSKDDIAKLTSDNLFLKTQLGITETIRGNTMEEVEVARNETFEQKMEASKLFAELKKLRPLVEEYRQKMVHDQLTLEQQLNECRLQLQEEHINGTNATNMLKTEIRRLYEDRKEVKRARMLDEKSNQGLERKYLLAKEMVEKLKADRHELQRTAFELKMKAEEMERKYFDAQIMAKKMAEQAGRTVGEITARLASNNAPTNHGDDALLHLPVPTGLASLTPIKLPPPVWASIGSTPGGPNDRGPAPTGSKESLQAKGGSLASEKASSKSVVSEVSSELPDFQAWKLKIESLTCERAFLVDENNMMKAKVEDLTARLAKADRNMAQIQQRLKNMEKEVKNLQAQNKTATLKYQRAERVAASIERQFKDARPNTRIDYSLMVEAEPSTQLLAAMMIKMEEVRQQLQSHYETQRNEEIRTRAKTLLEWVEKYAGKNHHLMGTKAIPGIFSRTPFNAAELDQIVRDITEGRNTNTPTRPPPARILAPIASRIPEAKLKESQELKQYIRSNVGKNPKGIRVKPRPPPFPLDDPVMKEKTAQGPFLVWLVRLEVMQI